MRTVYRQSQPITRLEEFLSWVKDECPGQDTYLFRGQATDQPLVPSLGRGRLAGRTILQAERELMTAFRRQSAPYLRIRPSSAWDWLALAQHHGLPTRLLDWSINPLAALFFAVNEPAQDRNGAVVWLLRPDEKDIMSADRTDPLTLKRHAVFPPTHISERITAQAGWFTVHARPAKRAGRLEPLERSRSFGRKLTKVAIPAERIADIRFDLYRSGVDDAAVYPGLDGLCKRLKWNCFNLRDEGKGSYIPEPRP